MIIKYSKNNRYLDWLYKCDLNKEHYDNLKDFVKETIRLIN